MEIESIQEKIFAEEYVYTSHADIERKADDLTLMQVEEALLNGEILEQYSDTGRGESCLILGYSSNLPIHIVCGWRGGGLPLSPSTYQGCPNLLIQKQGLNQCEISNVTPVVALATKNVELHICTAIKGNT